LRTKGEILKSARIPYGEPEKKTAQTGTQR
jgi:hypothetical protein